MVGHGTRTQDRQSVSARAKVEPSDDQRDALCRPGVPEPTLLFRYMHVYLKYQYR